jgi:hypothetical protein
LRVFVSPIRFPMARRNGRALRSASRALINCPGASQLSCASGLHGNMVTAGDRQNPGDFFRPLPPPRVHYHDLFAIRAVSAAFRLACRGAMTKCRYWPAPACTS